MTVENVDIKPPDLRAQTNQLGPKFGAKLPSTVAYYQKNRTV